MIKKLTLITLFILNASPVCVAYGGITFDGVDINGVNTVYQPEAMCLGNSITNGIGSSGNMGWYPELQENLNTTVTFVGPYTNSLQSNPFYNHCAVNGTTSSQHLVNIAGCLSYFKTTMQKSVVILSGTNDIGSATVGCNPGCDEGDGACTNGEEQAISDNIISIINTIIAFDSTINIYVMEITERSVALGEAFCNTDIASTNTKLFTDVSGHSAYNSKLFWIDTSTFDEATMLHDEVHPNDVGHAHLGGLIATAINAN